MSGCSSGDIRLALVPCRIAPLARFCCTRVPRQTVLEAMFGWNLVPPWIVLEDIFYGTLVLRPVVLDVICEKKPVPLRVVYHL